ncbi:MAG: sulfate/molybdate ABC transporter ATP-binding protein [Bacillota bacterium]
MVIEMISLVKDFGSFRAVDMVSFTVERGELMGLLGPSGGGKSTILRMVAGLEEPTGGKLIINGRLAEHIPPQQRGIGMVFQHYALFKHMTVYDNIAFGLQVRKLAKKQIAQRVGELLDLMGLATMADRFPHQLSGGQRQRVALARSLAPRPEVLLLDEPFGAVDAKIRRELRRWLRQLHDEVGITSVFVTHDQEEALEVADRIVIINKGKVEQIGTPREIYEQPATEFVANFIGPVNVLPAMVIRGKAQAGPLRVLAPGFQEGDKVNLVIRPSDIVLENPGQVMEGHGRIRRLVFLGEMSKVEIDMEGGHWITAHLPRGHQSLLGLNIGDLITLKIDGGQVFPQDSPGIGAVCGQGEGEVLFPREHLMLS